MTPVKHQLKRLAFVGDYQPRKCGIATFNHDLCEAMATQYAESNCVVIAVNDVAEGYDYPDRVRFEFDEQDRGSYVRAAEFLNVNQFDAVCLQHEFGIYGGDCGEYILDLLATLNMPAVTTLHTILNEPTDGQREVMEGLVALSTRLVVMSRRGSEFLREIYGVSEEKIDIIPHGIHDVPFIDPNFYKDQFDADGQVLLLTFGLLGPNKGIEYMIRALPAIVERCPDVVYIVLGATHPNLIRHEGESYRDSLKSLASELGVSDEIVFHDRFVDVTKLMEYIGAADIYITPYLGETQITSGTLAYSVGAGKAVVSTPYWHAQELLADDRGMLVPFSDPEALSAAVIELITNESRRNSIRKNAYTYSRDMIWPKTAERYMESLYRSLERTVSVSGDAAMEPTLILERLDGPLPVVCLDHLARMTDSTGLLQHAVFDMPNYDEGYAVDDNARALILTVLCENLPDLDPALVATLSARYMAFINYSFNGQRMRFRNFLGYDRRWREETGSEDSHSRTLWALGTVLGRSGNDELQRLAVSLFSRGTIRLNQFNSPRAWAFAIHGLHEYLKRYDGDRPMTEVFSALTTRLHNLYRHVHEDDWQWFEEVLTYSNAKLPHALILGGRMLKDDGMVDDGMKALDWLMNVQTRADGRITLVGNKNFYRRGGTMPQFDQQPIEAHAMMSACLAAYEITGDSKWSSRTVSSFNWFLGDNDLGLPLADVATGACRDGLEEGRVNQNRGAESTLAFLLAVAELKACRVVGPNSE